MSSRNFELIRAASLALAALAIVVGCTPTNGPKGTGESLALSFAASPTTKAAESNAPFIGQVSKDDQHFWFVLKGLSVQDGGNTVDKSYTAGLTASYVKLYLPNVIAALLSGKYAAAQTTTVNAYADGTAFALVTDTTGTTYIVHIDHKTGEKVTVGLTWNNSRPQVIPENGFIAVKPGALKVDAYTKITDNDALPELPPAIANEVNALRLIAKNAGIP